MTFLKSYVQVMKPVSIAMDLLQGEQERFIGPVIPTVMGIQQKLKSMTVDPVVNPLVMALNNGLSRRFRNMFDDESYHVGTMLILKFKLRYLPESDRQVKKLVLTQAVCALDREKQSVLPEAAATAIQPHPSVTLKAQTLTICLHLSLMIPRCLQQAVKMSSMKLTATCQMLM